MCRVFVLVLLAGSAFAEDRPVVADAAEAADWVLVRTLLSAQADVQRPQRDGATALHWAVLHDHLETVKLLVESGANVAAANDFGVTPLSIACQSGSTDIVQILLDRGADPHTTLPSGETALMTASRSGRVTCVRVLLAHGAAVNARERHDQTAVMWAAAEGHADVVTTLISSGADFRSPLSTGFTPLFFAVREGRRDATAALLTAGADVHEVMQPKRHVPKGVRSPMSPLLLAVENGHFELAVDLLKAGADPNDQRSGFAPLHVLTWVRKPNRGDDEDGDPAPIGSGMMSSLQFARELVARGANVNLPLTRGESGRGKLNRRGCTPFLLAAKTADLPYLELLLELGADPLLSNADGCTPLMAAAGIGTLAPGEEAGTESEALAAVAMMLDLGSDVNHVDHNGETAMHGAAYKNLPLVVELLHNRGAQVATWNRPNQYGWTPLDIARGNRPGNFKPSATTISALERLLNPQ